MGLVQESRNQSHCLEDLWPEILKRSLVKTLFRFQYVCKKWKSIISSSSLIASHRSFASLTPPNHKPYLRINAGEVDHNSYTLHKPNGQPQTLHFPFRFAGNLAGRHPNEVYHLKMYRTMAYTRSSSSFKKSSLNFTCVDIIHGVVCISYSLDSGFDSTILWNPVIQKYLSIPKPNFHLDRDHETAHSYDTRFSCHAIGFGYDESKNDFMVARIWIPCRLTKRKLGSNARPICEVYSLGEGQWRRVSVTNSNNYKLKQEGCEFNKKWSLRGSCYVSGKIHWIIRVGGHTTRILMLSLECESQELTTTELPSRMLDGDVPVVPMVLNYASMLSVVLTFGLPSRENAVELWVMSADDTWHKLYGFKGKDISVDYGSSLFEGIMMTMKPPYGPHQWQRLHRCNFWFHEVLSDHVFQETLCFIDDPNARSYTKGEEVQIVVA